ncbi:MAG: FtsX-like permease family protein [Lachnospiraceae bacterium]
MKKTQITELLRTIRKSPVLFLSIIIVTALGIAAFCGISFSSVAVTQMGERYYEQANFYNIKLFSPTGFTQADVDKLHTVSGVEDVYAGYNAQKLISIGSKKLVAEFFTQSDTINLPDLKEGRFPLKNNECTIELPLAKKFGLKIGDVISLSSDIQPLYVNEFTIVGIAELPLVLAKDDYYNRGVSSLGDGQVDTLVIVNDNAFDDDLFLGKPVCYVTTSNTESVFSTQYKQEEKKIQRLIEDLGKETEQAKYDNVRSEYEKKLADAKVEYLKQEDAYNDGLRKYESNKLLLNSKKNDIETMKRALDISALNEKQDQINRELAKLDPYYAQLSEQGKQLEETNTQLAQAKAQLDILYGLLTRITDTSCFYLGYGNEGQIKIGSNVISAAFLVQLGQVQKPVLIEGTMPTEQDECIIDISFAQKYGLKPGDILTPKFDKSLKISGIYQPPTSEMIDGVATTKIETIILVNDKTYYQNQADLKLVYYVSANNNYYNLFENYSPYIEKFIAEHIGKDDNFLFLSLDTLKEKLKIYVDTMRTQYLQKHNEYLSARDQYNVSKDKLDSNKSALLYAKASLEGAMASADALARQIAEGTKQIQVGYLKLAQAKAKLDDAALALENGKLRITDAEIDMNKINLAHWNVTGVDSNPSFHHFTTNLKGMNSVALTCCILLLLIAMLVCYTTIERMVTEQHQLIGAQKALGLKPREIYAKYMAYALVSAVLGVILGATAAYGIMETIIYHISYSAAYQATDFIPAFEIGTVLIIASASIISTVLAAWMASRRLVRQSAVSLLSGAPREMKHSRLNGHSRLSLDFSMALRNISANKKILLTTIVGVAGCTVLLIVVFTVRTGMAGITNRQYHELQHYDGIISMDAKADETDKATILDIDSQIEGIQVCEQYRAFLKDDEYHYTTVISSKDPQLTEYITLLDATTGKRMEISSDGVLLSKKCAEEYGYQVGDDFIMTDNAGNSCTAVISGIFERNIGNAIIISPAYYRKISGEELAFNQYFVKLLDTDKDVLISQLQDQEAFVDYSPTDLYVDEFNDKLSSVDSAVTVILFVTFFLSVFVLLNLAVMNIAQKETEIKVMKVMGLSHWRIKKYVLCETMLMSFCGLLVGVLLGAPIGAFITKAIELEGIQNIRGISINACIVGILICVLFFTAANLLSLFKIKKIKTT